MKPWLFNSIYAILIAVLSPWLLWRCWRTGRYREGLKQKFLGLDPKEWNNSKHLFSADSPLDPGSSPSIWLHGVSVGEVQLLIPLMESIQQNLPSSQLVLSTTTVSGMELAEKLLAKRMPEVKCFYFPLDFSWSVKRTLATLQPDLLITGELELWPNLIAEVARREVPILVANGRLSEKSYRGYRRLSMLTR
ncbi:MAG: glycosyltransferase N-terminal domain-containing protein, partial [Planctomycetota bacterium]